MLYRDRVGRSFFIHALRHGIDFFLCVHGLPPTLVLLFTSYTPNLSLVTFSGLVWPTAVRPWTACRSCCGLPCGPGGGTRRQALRTHQAGQLAGRQHPRLIVGDQALGVTDAEALARHRAIKSAGAK